MSAKPRVLLAIGAALSLLTYFGVAVAHFVLNDYLNEAAKKGDLTAVKALLAKGAAADGRSMHFMTPLMSAAEGGHTEIVLFLLDKGADIDAHNDSGSVLMWAASVGNTDMVRLLLKRGADVQWQNSMGDVALKTAKEFNHPEIVKMLKHAGTTK